MSEAIKLIHNYILLRLRGLRWRRLLIVVIPFAAKQPSEEALLLLFLLIRRGLSRARLGRSCCRLRAHRWRRQRRHAVRRRRGYSSVLSNPKKLLEDIALIASALVAGLRGRSSVKKNRIVVRWATGIGKQVGHFIQPHRRDSSGRSELAGI
jgi:hypothetical protein